MTATPPAGDQSSGTVPSIIDKTPQNEPAKVTFESAWQKLPDYGSSGLINLTGLTIHLIHGMGVASDGSADTWIVGVQQGKRSSLLVYDRQSWSQVAWGETFAQKIITFDHIFLPTQIYDTNRKVIEEVMNAKGVEVSNMDLSEGVYTVSIGPSNDSSMIRFNASTGELVSVPI